MFWGPSFLKGFFMDRQVCCVKMVLCTSITIVVVEILKSGDVLSTLIARTHNSGAADM